MKHAECVFVCYLSPRSSPVDIYTLRSRPQLHFSRPRVESSPSLAPASPSLLTTKSSIGSSAAKLQAISQTPAAVVKGRSAKRRICSERNADEGVGAHRRLRGAEVPGEIYNMKV